MEKQFAYVLSVDATGRVIGYEAQEFVNALPELKCGDMLVSESIYRHVHEGSSKSERFRYVGGDLISDGIDLDVYKREVLAVIRKRVLAGLQFIQIVCGSTNKSHLVRVDDALLSHLQLAKARDDVAVLISVNDVAVRAYAQDIDFIFSVILQRRNDAHIAISTAHAKLEAARSEKEVDRIASDNEERIKSWQSA